jgi:L-aspartate oxidase
MVAFIEGDILLTEFVVLGGGIAGLRAALELASAGPVTLVTKEQLGESNTNYAQGGIAVALGGPTDVALHLTDTLNAGDGLVARSAAEVLVAEGPARVEELIAWGAEFDRRNGVLIPGREAAHSLPRVYHAHGDATGGEVSRALVARARSERNITILEDHSASDLILHDGRVIGVELISQTGERSNLYARAILLASGGAGMIFSETTNPSVTTGDGLAIALRAGAELADLEFYQFHPTAFCFPGAPRFLMTEALRGEGAYLRNHLGERFMERYHPMLELAPRDVVARAIARESLGQQPVQALPVYLDLRHITSVDLHQRFPGISAFLHRYSLDLSRDLIPVCPAAHYMMGGVRTDQQGRTTLAGLYAAGEVACTGVHGANRLASNSLLEGLVFGARAAKAMLDEPALPSALPLAEPKSQSHPAAPLDGPVREIRSLLWLHAGLLREGASLQQGESALAVIESKLSRRADNRASLEASSMLLLGRAILHSALARTESRGAHFRSDYPRRDDENFQRHSILRLDGNQFSLRFEPWN